MLCEIMQQSRLDKGSMVNMTLQMRNTWFVNKYARMTEVARSVVLACGNMLIIYEEILSAKSLESQIRGT